MFSTVEPVGIAARYGAIPGEGTCTNAGDSPGQTMYAIETPSEVRVYLTGGRARSVILGLRTRDGLARAAASSKEYTDAGNPLAWPRGASNYNRKRLKNH